MVYVIRQNGQPLMPTFCFGKVRHLLKEGKEKVVQRTPLTIQLMHQTPAFVQAFTLGLDASNKAMGPSASTPKQELYAYETALRGDLGGPLSDRRKCSGKSFLEASFMDIMRRMFHNKLKEIYGNASLTHGYITKNTRSECGLPKTHAVDALRVAGHLSAKRLEHFMTHDIRRMDGAAVHLGLSCEKLKMKRKASTLLTERRTQGVEVC